MCVSAGPGVNEWASLNSADRGSSLKMVEQGQRGLDLDLTEREWETGGDVGQRWCLRESGE